MSFKTKIDSYRYNIKAISIVDRGNTECGVIPWFVLFFWKKINYSKSYRDNSKIPRRASPGRSGRSK